MMDSQWCLQTNSLKSSLTTQRHIYIEHSRWG